MLNFFLLRTGSPRPAPFGIQDVVPRERELVARFERLVQRLLPTPCRCQLEWQASAAFHNSDSWRATLTVPPMSLGATNPGWSTVLRDLIEQIIRASRPLNMTLVDAEDSTILGAFEPNPAQFDSQIGLPVPHSPPVIGGQNFVRDFGRLDVYDLERYPNRFAADVL